MRWWQSLWVIIVHYALIGGQAWTAYLHLFPSPRKLKNFTKSLVSYHVQLPFWNFCTFRYIFKLLLWFKCKVTHLMVIGGNGSLTEHFIWYHFIFLAPNCLFYCNRNTNNAILILMKHLVHLASRQIAAMHCCPFKIPHQLQISLQWFCLLSKRFYESFFLPFKMILAFSQWSGIIDRVAELYHYNIWNGNLFVFVDYEGKKDYCERDIFSPECPADHVVLMVSAVYGRMGEGECITGNYGTIGCSEDVLK